MDLELPWRDLPQHFRDVVLYGSGDEKIKYNYRSDSEEGSWSAETERTAKGIIYHIDRLFRSTESESTRLYYAGFMSKQPCPACNGTKLCVEARSVLLGSKPIAEVSAMPVDEVLAWLSDLLETLPGEALEIGGEALNELGWRLQFLLSVGLHYLTLDRPAATLSGGEGQRIRLASQIGLELVGLLYVLDEPSVGLHARDQQALIDALKQVRDMGNTVLVVEHDEATMRAADWLIDMGPGAGDFGGEVVAEGAPEQVASNGQSLTGRYLRGELSITAPNGGQRRKADKGWLALIGARLHNLQHIDVYFPLGLFTCITGVSGSGKSSLVADTLYPALQNMLHESPMFAGPYERLAGGEQIKKVITITQEPIGRTPRSNPATYVGIFDLIRWLFAQTPLAQQRGYDASRFSFNVKGGCCEACQGLGQCKINMHFLSDVWITCKECKGKRFNAETLEILYYGKTIAEVLDLDVHQALTFFNGERRLVTMLQTLQDVGLGYIKLGQAATTLSGGEAQRIKLASELCRPSSGNTLYILDEPTTGLHFSEVQRLLNVLHLLVDKGNTVIVVEHNLDVIKTADWVIDLGPEGGAEGGRIVAAGPPEEIAQAKDGYTGKFLREVLR